MELSIYLRTEINNKFMKLVKKDKCEKCGTTENLEVHHIKQFIILLDETLELLNLEYKDTEEYSKEDLNKIKLILLGKHLDGKYKTLCQKCHDDVHNITKKYKQSVKKPRKLRKKYDNTNRTVNGKQGDFIRLILDIKKGSYKDIIIVDIENKTIIIRKKDICKLIKTDKGHLKRRILDQPLVNDFINSNNIINQGQKIIIPM